MIPSLSRDIEVKELPEKPKVHENITVVPKPLVIIRQNNITPSLSIINIETFRKVRYSDYNNVPNVIKEEIRDIYNGIDIDPTSSSNNQELLNKALKKYFILDSIPNSIYQNLDVEYLESFVGNASEQENMQSRLIDLFKDNPTVFEQLGKQKSDSWLENKTQEFEKDKKLYNIINQTKKTKLQESLKSGELDIEELTMLDSLLKTKQNILPKDMGELGKKSWKIEKDGKLYMNKVFDNKPDQIKQLADKAETLQQESLLPILMDNMSNVTSPVDEDAFLEEIKKNNKTQVKEQIISESENLKKVTIKDRKNPLPNNLLFENFIGVTRGADMNLSLGTQVGKKINKNLALGLGLTFQHTEDKTAQVSTILGYKAFGRYTMLGDKFAVLLENISLLPDISYLKVNENYNYFENTTLLGAAYRIKLLGNIGFSISVLYNFNDKISAPALDAPWLTRFGIKF